MQMYIMQKEQDTDELNRAVESVKQAFDMSELQKKHIVVISGGCGCGKTTLLHSLIERLAFIDNDISEYNSQLSMFAFDSDKPAASPFEAMCVLRDSNGMWHSYINSQRDNSVHLNREFLISQMRTRVHQTGSNVSCLGESILHLQKEDTFKTNLFVPKATQLSRSSYTNVSAAYASDSRLFWVHHSTFSCSWIQQLFRKAERSFLAQLVFEHLSELREIAKLYQYHSTNRHLRRKGFSPGFTILTYSIKLPWRFCTLSHCAPKSEMLSTLNSEQGLYTSIDRQEDAIIDISMIIFAEFVRMVWYQTAEMYF